MTTCIGAKIRILYNYILFCIYNPDKYVIKIMAARIV